MGRYSTVFWRTSKCEEIAHCAFAIFLMMGLSSVVASAERQIEWYKIFNVKVKPGKASEADASVKEHFTPVDEKVGLDVITFVYQTGPWDRISYSPAVMTEQGIDTVPSEKVWWDAFVAQEGGEKEATARLSEWSDLVAVFEMEIAKPQQ